MLAFLWLVVHSLFLDLIIAKCYRIVLSFNDFLPLIFLNAQGMWFVVIGLVPVVSHFYSVTRPFAHKPSFLQSHAFGLLLTPHLPCFLAVVYFPCSCHWVCCHCWNRGNVSGHSTCILNLWLDSLYAVFAWPSLAHRFSHAGKPR